MYFVFQATVCHCVILYKEKNDPTGTSEYYFLKNRRLQNISLPAQEPGCPAVYYLPDTLLKAGLPSSPWVPAGLHPRHPVPPGRKHTFAMLSAPVPGHLSPHTVLRGGPLCPYTADGELKGLHPRPSRARTSLGGSRESQQPDWSKAAVPRVGFPADPWGP